MEWLASLIPIVLMLMNQGNNQSQQTTQTTTAEPRGYQSPILGLMDMLMANTLGQNLNVYGTAGLPRGMSIAPGILQDFLRLMQEEYLKTQAGVEQSGKESYRGGTVGSVKTYSPNSPGQVRSYGNYAGR